MTSLVERVRNGIRPWDTGGSPMEIRRAILDELETKVVAVGHGKKILPYRKLRLHLLAEDPEQRIILDTATTSATTIAPPVRVFSVTDARSE